MPVNISTKVKRTNTHCVNRRINISAKAKKTKMSSLQHSSLSKHQNLSDFSNSTSEFNKRDVYTLNINYVDASSPDDIVYKCIDNVKIPKEVYVADLSTSEIQKLRLSTSECDNLDDDVKSFIQLINYILENETVVRGTEESRTDALVYSLLTKLEFGKYPLMIQPQPVYKFKIRTKDISSKLDIAVLKDRKVVLIDEDKHIRNTGPGSAWGEHQIAGEMVASAYSSYSLASKRYDEVSYGIRVIGLRFTFYKAVITSEYLDSLDLGFPDVPVNILRYPPVEQQEIKDRDFPYLDYGEREERNKIIDILVKIREAVKNK